MYEHLETFPDEVIQLSSYEDGISNRQRRSLRRQPTAQRREDARSAQEKSGLRIRIWRKVLNEQDFGDQLRVWHKPQQDKVAKRKEYRQFTLTVFDTAQQPLRHIEPYDQDEWTELLERKQPTLFRELGPLATAGVAKLGSKSSPFLALTFRDQAADVERRAVRDIVAPELILDDSHQLVHRPHVTLGKIIVPSVAECQRVADEIQAQLEPVRPGYVLLGPAHVDVIYRSMDS